MVRLVAVDEALVTAVVGYSMAHVVAFAEADGARCVWLGVNQQNARAQRFYAKQGFVQRGVKRFRVGSRIEDDFVMVRSLATD